MSIQSYLQNSDTLPGFVIVYMGQRDTASGIKPGDSTDIVTQKLLTYVRTLPVNPTAIKALFDGSAPLAYDESTGMFSIGRASATQDGYLNKDDFAAFNGKVSSVASQTATGQDIYAATVAGVAKIKKILGTGSANITSDGNLITVNVPTIPAQFNPIPGTNMSFSGTYPNITFNATGGSGGGYSSDYNTLF